MKSIFELQAELDSFQGIWSGEFYDGDPADMDSDYRSPLIHFCK